MDLDEATQDRIRALLPRERGNISHDAMAVLEAVVFKEDSGCAWRQLPQRFGNWHTVYTRASRWARGGTLAAAVLEFRKSQAASAQPAQAARAGRRAVAAPVPPEVKDLADRLRPLIFRLAMHLKNERRRFPVSQLDVAVLMYAQAHPGATNRMLAPQIESTTATVGVMVRRMAERGWLAPMRSAPGAGLRGGVTITEAGARLLEAVRAGRTDQLLRQFAALGPAEVAAVEAAVEPLQRIAQGLQQSLPLG